MESIQRFEEYNVIMKNLKKERSKEDYFSHDNGGRPFKIVIEKDRINVYKRKGYDEDSEEIVYETKQLLTIDKFIKVYPGVDQYNDVNSVLIHIEKKIFIFVGLNITSFNLKDDIQLFISQMGNNDVVYPYIIGDKYIYLLGESLYFDKNLIKEGDDPYYSYGYSHDIPDIFPCKDEIIKQRKENLKKLSMKVIQERL